MLVYSRCKCSSCGSLARLPSAGLVTCEQRRRFKDLRPVSGARHDKPSSEMLVFSSDRSLSFAIFAMVEILRVAHARTR